MKNLYVFFLIVCPLLVGAQTYELSVRQGTYQDLENSISLNNGEVWDDPNYEVPLGFNFRYFDQELDTLYLDGETLNLGAILSSFNAPTIIQVLAVNGADLIDRGYLADTSLSNISYLVEGDAGSRIFKMEWKNVGFFTELFDDDVSEDFTNFQLWLFEEDDAIQIHFGPKSINYPDLSYDDSAGTFVGLIDSFNIDEDETSFGEAYFLEGDPLNPIFREIFVEDLDGDPITLNGDIPEGTIYRFARRTSSSEEIEELQFTIAPNPVVEQMTIEWPLGGGAKTEVELFNASGQLMQRWEQVENGSALDLKRFAKGIYFVRLPEVSSGSYKIYKD